ncbi:hypothetical protein JTE90_029531 [Oedothorax gibbosus]|uniref:Uncharacterized protein n=1 Tax=Oedothorax gibbosus TaxID=931172 RepID=A0AAV6VAT0_9ARAC|nr:hypothetical protein JTE90_029531 [Oedothorax gibbosus]
MYPNLLTQTSIYSPLLRCTMPLVSGTVPCSSPLSPTSSPPAVSSSFLVDNILRERAAAGPFLARPVAVGPDQSCPSCCSSPQGQTGKGGRCCQNGQTGGGGSNGNGAGSTPYLKFGMSAILAAETKEKIAAKNVLAVSVEGHISQDLNNLSHS